eukprot:4623087-Pyramimonas_sp.AAC.1
MRLRAIERRARIWAPFSRRLYLRSLKVGCEEVFDPARQVRLATEYWAPVFSTKPWDSKAASVYVERFMPCADFSRVPPPTVAKLTKTLKAAVRSTPG